MAGIGNNTTVIMIFNMNQCCLCSYVWASWDQNIVKIEKIGNKGKFGGKKENWENREYREDKEIRGNKEKNENRN